MIPSHADLTYFLETASTLNVSRAAERLGISQPSLSMALKRLESSLGASLLIRKKSGVELTSAGKFLVQRGRSVVQELESLKAGVLKSVHGLSGRYTLGCHAAVGLYSLPKFLPRLLMDCPQIEVMLEHDLSRLITDRVIRYQLDFGLVVNPVSHPDLVIQELFTDRVGLWDLSGKIGSTLIFDSQLLQTQYVLEKLEAKNVKFLRQIPSSSLEVIARLAGAGAGTAILPSRVVAEVAPKLKSCGPGYPHFNDRICLIYRVDAQKTSGFRVVMDAVKSLKVE